MSTTTEKVGNTVIVDKDLGYSKLLKKFAGLSDVVAKVGIQGSDAEKQPYEKESITLLGVGIIHEFGVPEHGIVERSFLRSTADVNDTKYRNLIRKAAQDTLIKPNMRAEQALFIVGQIIRKDVVDRMRGNQIRPDISDERKAQKGSDIVLVDDGFLVGAITSVITKRESGDGGGDAAS